MNRVLKPIKIKQKLDHNYYFAFDLEPKGIIFNDVESIKKHVKTYTHINRVMNHLKPK